MTGAPGEGGGPPGIPPELLDPGVLAAERELHKIDTAEKWQSPPFRAMAQPLPPRPMAPPPSKLGSTGKSTPALEDLCARFPIGQGYTLRVIRSEPKRDPLGQLAAGWLADLEKPVGMADFTREFGGGTYQLSVIGAGPNGATAQLAHTVIQIPGAPLLLNPQCLEGKDQMLPNVVQQAEPVQIRLQQMKQEEEREKRMDDERRQALAAQQEMARASGPSDAVVLAIRGQADKTVDDIKDAHSKQVEMLINQGREYKAGFLEKSAEVTRLQGELAEARRMLIETEHHVETKMITELRDRHLSEVNELKERYQRETSELRERLTRETAEIRDRWNAEVKEKDSRHQDEALRVQKEHNDKVAQLAEDSRVRIDEMTRRFEEERHRLETSSREEKEAIRREQERSEKQIERGFEQRIATMKDQYDGRISDLVRTTEREVSGTKEDRDRTVTSLKTQYEGQAKFEREAMKLKIETLQSELGKQEQKVTSLEHENKILNQKLNKPITEAISEINANARLLGMIHKDEVEVPEPAQAAATDTPTDWKSIAMKVGMQVAEKSPELLQKLSEMRQAASAPRAAPQHVAPAALQPIPDPREPMGALPQQGRRQIGPRPGARGAPPVPGSAYGMPSPIQGPPPLVSVPYYNQPPQPRGAVVTAQEFQPDMAPAIGYAPSMPAPSPLQPAPATGPAQAPMAEAPEMRQPQPTPSQAPPAMQQQGWAPPVSVAPPASAQAQPPGTDQMAEFVNELEKAITEGIISPTAFANLFIGRVGPDIAAQAVQALTPQQLIEVVSSLPQGAQMAIVRRDGQKYVHALWQETEKQLRQMGKIA